MLDRVQAGGLEGVVAAETVLCEVDGAGRAPGAARPFARGDRRAAQLRVGGGHCCGRASSRRSRRGLAPARSRRDARRGVPGHRCASLPADRRPGADRGDAGAGRRGAGRRRPTCRCAWSRRVAVGLAAALLPRRPARRRSRPIRRSATPPTSCACCAARRPPSGGDGARDLSGHRHRPRAERLDLHRPRGRLDPRRPGLLGDGGALRAEGAAAWRRARAGARHAGRDRHAGERRGLARQARSTRGDRLMGFGHRVYRVRDPRADALKRAVALLLRPLPGRLRFAEAVEAAALAVLEGRKPDRSLQTNVEFYTALLLEALGVPPRRLHLRLRHRPRAPAGSPMPGNRRRRPPDPPAIALCRARADLLPRRGLTLRCRASAPISAA